MSAGFDPNRRDCMMKEYTLLGDPSLQVWTKVPAVMNVDVDPSIVPVGQVTPVQITVTKPNSNPVSGALVCLQNGADVYVYGYTNASGSVTLSVDPSSAGDIDLTITAYNRIPYFGTISVTTSPIPKSPATVNVQTTILGDVQLTWSPVTQDTGGNPISIDHYEVFRQNTAHFMTGSLTPVASPTGTSYVDPAASGDPNANHFYRIVAVSTSGAPSSPSASVGEFDYDLAE